MFITLFQRKAGQPEINTSIAKQDFMVAKQQWSLVGFGKSKNSSMGVPARYKFDRYENWRCSLSFLVSYKPSLTTVTKVKDFPMPKVHTHN